LPQQLDHWNIYSFRPSERQSILVVQPMDSSMDQHQENNIKVLLESLESLRITEEDVLEETTEYIDKMSVVPAPAIAQNE